MSTSPLFEAIRKQAANVAPFGAVLKFVLGEEIIVVDGSGTENVVTSEDIEAACTISCDPETFEQLKSGTLNPMVAVMSGKVKIKGDMGLAMKLQSLI